MVILIVATFVIGYIAIALEHSIRVNKAATALITGVVCWTFYILFTANKEFVTDNLLHHLGDLSQILFFLLGAMTIVELIDAHDGFEIITKRITTKNKKKLLWIIGILSFILSAVLDNLTTAIVMISLIRKLIDDKKDRMMFAGAIIICANAGGAWSPIGDVTTTMLWIGGQITATNIIVKLIVPSLVCMIAPLFVMQFFLRGEVQAPLGQFDETETPNQLHRNIVFFAGIGILLMVPVFKTLTHLPPFMGILLGLGILWIIVEVLHSDKDEQDRKYYTVAYALRKIDSPSILFFLGILLAIAALESTGQLHHLAQGMDEKIGNQNLIVLSIGLLSSIVDNVPLVAASMGMYSLQQYPTDHYFWEFLAYATGTGGSVLIIGSAAGVAVMGIEKIDFLWYLKRISWLALIGYLAGAVTYILQASIL
ncbi:MAG TPA: sodium:proton antiporter NhaD [Flavisolibacter sp.]|nr:sodium:proton antiporter NhaD [Flavisolibacter sp.]